MLTLVSSGSRYNNRTVCVKGVRGAQFVEALCYKPAGRGFDSPCDLWDFFFYRLNPSGRTMSLGSTEPLAETSTSCTPCAVTAAGAQG
jgi:hypothetical protein